MENLITDLKRLDDQGLSLEQADERIFDKTGLMLSPITRKFENPKGLTLTKLIANLEQIVAPERRFREAVDTFADREKNIPIQTI